MNQSKAGHILNSLLIEIEADQYQRQHLVRVYNDIIATAITTPEIKLTFPTQRRVTFS